MKAQDRVTSWCGRPRYVPRTITIGKEQEEEAMLAVYHVCLVNEDSQ